MSVAAVEPDALPFPAARQVFDTRNTTTFKKDGTNHPPHSLLRDQPDGPAKREPHHLAALARGQWSVENPNHWRRDALWGEDRCRLRNKNAACALALLRTALLRPVLRCGWGPTKRSSNASPHAPATASNSSPNAPSCMSNLKTRAWVGSTHF